MDTRIFLLLTLHPLILSIFILENYPSRMTGKSKAVLKKHSFIERSTEQHVKIKIIIFA
jgi:hypothetical protein